MSASSPTSVKNGGERLLSDLRLLTAYAASGRLPVTQKGTPEKRALFKFAEKRGTSDGTYGFFLWLLAEPVIGRHPFEAADVWDADGAGSWLKLIDRAISSNHWMEGYSWRHMAWSPRSFQDTSAPARRLHMLQALRGCPATEWVDWTVFLSHLQTPMLRRADAIAQVASGGYTPDGKMSIEDTSAAIIGETFRWLGLVETGLQAGRLPGAGSPFFTHFRLTPRGRLLADNRPAEWPKLAAPPLEKTFKILPNHDISIPPRLEPALLARLLKVADLTGPSTLCITKQSLRSALDNGETLDAILDFLKSASSTGLPENVEIFVRDLCQKHGQIKIGYAGLYIEVTDPMLLLELESQPRMKGALVKKVGDRMALIKTEDPQALARTLKKLGYLPVIDIQKDNLDVMIPWKLRRRF